MSAATQRGSREYQCLVAVEHHEPQVLVRFENGDHVTVGASRLLPPDARGADWDALTFTPHEIVVPTADGEVEISWSTIRALTDRDYSNHLAAAAEEQARKVGQRLRALRESRGLTAREVAERAGITSQSLSRIEHGHHDVVYTTLQRILAAMGYTLRDLIVPPPELATTPKRSDSLSSSGDEQRR